MFDNLSTGTKLFAAYMTAKYFEDRHEEEEKRRRASESFQRYHDLVNQLSSRPEPASRADVASNYCTECGAALAPRANFCGSCGAPAHDHEYDLDPDERKESFKSAISSALRGWHDSTERWQSRYAIAWGAAFDRYAPRWGFNNGGRQMHSIVSTVIANGTPEPQIMEVAVNVYWATGDRYTCEKGHQFVGLSSVRCPRCGTNETTLQHYYICEHGHCLRGLPVSACPVCGSSKTHPDGPMGAPTELREWYSVYNSCYREAHKDFHEYWNNVAQDWEDFSEGWEYRFLRMWCEEFDVKLESVGCAGQFRAIVGRLIKNIYQEPVEIVDSWGGLDCKRPIGVMVLETIERSDFQAGGKCLLPITELAESIYFELIVVPDSRVGKCESLETALTATRVPTSPNALQSFRAIKHDPESVADMLVQKAVACQKRQNEADRHAGTCE